MAMYFFHIALGNSKRGRREDPSLYVLEPLEGKVIV